MTDFLKSSTATGFIIQGMGDLLLTVGDRAPSAAAVEWLEREAGSFADQRRGRAAYMHFTREGEFAMPDDAARQAMQRFVSKAGVKFAASAVVVAQGGFMGSALRSVFSGVLLAVRIPTPTKIFANAVDGHAWLLTTTPASLLPDADRLTKALAKMTAAPGAQAQHATAE